ncbi:MAG: HNH endonuclease [Clostridiales bacterium]|nr:HNH endonuclease [Clostridiales bacterium]
MAKREAIKTTLNSIVEYWGSRVDECDLSVDWAEADSHCWRCGCEKNLERCHIIPHSLQGKDEPSNYVLLCKRCHLENPNVADKEIMWDWLKAYKTSFYETFWLIQGLEEYKRIYGKSVVEELKKLGIKDRNKVLSSFKATHNMASFHFGQPYFNSATVAGLLRMMIKELEAETETIEKCNA